MELRRLHDIETLPAWARDDIRYLWESARSGAEPDVEQEAAALAYLDHPEFAVLADRYDELPDRFTVEGVNPRFHVAVHQVIETQLLNNDPPEARTTLAYLLDLGIDRHAAIHLMMDGLIKDIHAALQKEKPSGYVPFLNRLSRARLAWGPPSPKVGRNDACPCGSGKKYKKCCGADGPVPVIDLQKATMLLGDGIYAGEGAAGLPPSHPLVALDNLAAVAQELELQGIDGVAQEAYQRLVNAAALVDEEALRDALEDQMEFAMNHPAYPQDGIAAATRLLGLESGKPNWEMTTVDLAGFYETAGDSARAEATYRDLLAQNPRDPYVYIAWAKWLLGKGRIDEAMAAYQTVIDRKGMGDAHALRQAHAEQAQL